MVVVQHVDAPSPPYTLFSKLFTSKVFKGYNTFKEVSIRRPEFCFAVINQLSDFILQDTLSE